MSIRVVPQRVCKQGIRLARARGELWLVINTAKFRKADCFKDDSFPLSCDCLDWIVSVQSLDMLSESGRWRKNPYVLGQYAVKIAPGKYAHVPNVLCLFFSIPRS